MIQLSTPLDGMQRAEYLVSGTASRIATLSAGAPGSDTVGLSTEMVSLLTARNNFESNTKALETEDQITKTTLNLLA